MVYTYVDFNNLKILFEDISSAILSEDIHTRPLMTLVHETLKCRTSAHLLRILVGGTEEDPLLSSCHLFALQWITLFLAKGLHVWSDSDS